MTRVALDLLGGDRAPEQVVDGALLVADEQPAVDVVLVGAENREHLAGAIATEGRDNLAGDGVPELQIGLAEPGRIPGVVPRAGEGRLL